MDYKDTLLLPQTTFPMRGDLTKNETMRFKKWEEESGYNNMVKLRNVTDASFTLHDGPPYANGNTHIGHALNKILKDIIVKFHYFNGKKIRYTPGWDCHGLPIEQQIEKAIGKEKKETLPKEKIRQLCRNHASKYIDIQREEFKTLGVLADWAKPYVTMDFAFEANIYRNLIELANNGLLVQRDKPVYWSWAAKTALAEAEVEYKEKEDWSIFVAFELSAGAKAKIGSVQQAALVIWTTTPWTLPANTGISLNPNEEYALSSDGKIVADKLFENAVNLGIISGEKVAVFSSRVLENETAINPLNQRLSRIVLGEHVLVDNGTGCVHTAPGHGEDDYRVGLVYGLDVIMPVDEEGRYSGMIKELKLLSEEFVGVHIFDANEKIITLLGESCLKASKFNHSYPHCWRTHQPVIYRATKQWFVAMDIPFKDGKTLRQVALDEIEKVKFTPETGKNRLKTMIANRPDWCISRQRDWGVPIAFFRNKNTGDIILDAKVLNYVAFIFEKFGCDAWYSMSIEELLAPNSGLNPEDLEKENDILDVWFDSGSTWSSVLTSHNYDAGDYPASVYLEGSDQHRGWFQSSLLVSCGVRGHAPYQHIVTHGFTVDQNGNKMSKSLGNVVAPDKVIKEYGAEILRLWVASSDYAFDIKISDTILKQTAESYRKIRNTIRFLLANVEGLTDVTPISSWGIFERWIVSEAKEVFDDVYQDFASYEFAKGLSKLHSFLTTELSGIYLDISKDRLYCEDIHNEYRKHAQSAMAYIAQALIGLIAPILTHTCDEVLEHAPSVIKKDAKTVFDYRYESLPECEKLSFDIHLEARKMYYEVVDTLKKEGIIKSTLELGMRVDGLTLSDNEIQEWFGVGSCSYQTPLKELKHEKFTLTLGLSSLEKCPRCWKYASSSNECLCPRCQKVLQ